jgi:hypothetical protein
MLSSIHIVQDQSDQDKVYGDLANWLQFRKCPLWHRQGTTTTTMRSNESQVWGSQNSRNQQNCVHKFIVLMFFILILGYWSLINFPFLTEIKDIGYTYQFFTLIFIGCAEF